MQKIQIETPSTTNIEGDIVLYLYTNLETFTLRLAPTKTHPSYRLVDHPIVPIFKSGDKSLASNYHLISLLCNISKVMEHLVYNKIISCITTPPVWILKQQINLTPTINSFQPHYQCTTPNWCKNLDLCKAFDSVPHIELLLRQSMALVQILSI